MLTAGLEGGKVSPVASAEKERSAVRNASVMVGNIKDRQLTVCELGCCAQGVEQSQGGSAPFAKSRIKAQRHSNLIKSYAWRR